MTRLVTYPTWTEDTLATTTNAATTISTIAAPASTTLGIAAIVVGRRTGGTAGTAEDGAMYQILAGYKNVAGTATLIGSSITVVGESQAAWNATLTTSSGNVLIQVTGETDNNISWLCRYTLTQVSVT